uniref:ABC transporter domain-containing protein n=1 Tax=Aegilops tauschii subsp. strangulata TaxID=200361 RepID=A0A453MK44_AEGTS
RERKVAGAALVWKELSVSVRDGRRPGRVVRGSSGYALPGTLTVVMGPARSGKSTLLRAISGRLRGAERMYGEVFVNGVKSPLPYGSYVSSFFHLMYNLMFQVWTLELFA